MYGKRDRFFAGYMLLVAVCVVMALVNLIPLHDWFLMLSGLTLLGYMMERSLHDDDSTDGMI